jgi:hypothetical protein
MQGNIYILYLFAGIVKNTQVVTDGQGHILSVGFEPRKRLEESANEFSRSGALLGANQKVIEIDVSDEYFSLSTTTLMRRLEADLKAQA